jgi:hypothetical protein
MAMKSLTELRSLYKEPQLVHKWTIEVPTWPTAASPANPSVLFMITSASLPTAKFTPADIELGGFKIGFNGKEDRDGEIDWTFFENTDSDVIKYFFIDYANARQNYASNSSITLAAKENKELIAPTVNMNLMAADGTTITKQIQLINCMFEPQSYGASDLGQEVAVLKPTVKVTFDSFIWLKM